MIINLIASEKNWIESKAIDQLKHSAGLPGIFAAAGLPDLHPGKDAPIGAVFASENLIYPHLVGADIGCGMAMFQTNIESRKLKLDKWANKLSSAFLEEQPYSEIETVLKECQLASSQFDDSLGTIGGGNHFAELQKVHKVHDRTSFSEAGLEAEKLFILVHSGSRSLGASILREHLDEFKNSGLHIEHSEAGKYIEKHNHALKWAKVNRKLIARKFARLIAAETTAVLDLYHNCLEPGHLYGKNCYLHRKGAAASNRGLVIIPGSRGTLSYLVAPTGDQSKNLFSLAHGAGRKWARNDCRARLEKRYSADSFLKTELGGRVICTDRELLFEEAPQAYKDIDIVISDLLNHGLIRIIASFSPLISFKTSKRSKLDPN